MSAVATEARPIQTHGAVRIVTVKRFGFEDANHFTPCASGCRAKRDSGAGGRAGITHLIFFLDYDPPLGLCASCAREAKEALDSIFEVISE